MMKCQPKQNVDDLDTQAKEELQAFYFLKEKFLEEIKDARVNYITQGKFHYTPDLITNQNEQQNLFKYISQEKKTEDIYNALIEERSPQDFFRKCE